MKALIMEDNLQLNLAISEFFMIKAFDVVSVKDGLKAIDKIDSEHFDLYLFDVDIPHINVLDVFKHIRKTNLDTPIIIITASLEIEKFFIASENGNIEYIKKPFHLKELDIRINNLLTLCKPVNTNISNLI